VVPFLDVLELVLPDHSRLALADEVTIGRAPQNAVRLTDPSVSRVHARITAASDGAVLEDAGSSYGTWLDGRRVEAPTRLRAGSRIQLGNQELLIDRQRRDDEAGPTIVVADATAATRFGGYPRMHTGYALKRLEAGEGSRRWVLKDLRSGRLVRLADADAELLALLDGTRSLPELVREAERRLGGSGPARLTLLLASLGERGFLAGADEPEAATGRLRRLVASRHVAWSGAADLFDRLYRGGGRALVSRRAVVPLGALAAVGAVVFAYLVVGRYGTPFVVAHKVGIGGLVFLFGRLAVAAVHETAHGLVMASFGRRVREAGLKVVLIFPYVYVDTSDAWFEPRRHRIAVSAAGPASDLCLAGAFALCCLVAGPGTARDVFFQLAFGAYVGAFYNLNPLLERDGYQILVDVLGVPGLRQRARAQLHSRISVGRRDSDSSVLLRYSMLGLCWSALGASIAVAMSLRYMPAFAHLAPASVVWTVMCTLWVAMFLPVLVAVGPPLRERMRPRAG
jgi:putative peptide zinc metalloprotease protein